MDSLIKLELIEEVKVKFMASECIKVPKELVLLLAQIKILFMEDQSKLIPCGFVHQIEIFILEFDFLFVK
jgi:hypothetical protein